MTMYPTERQLTTIRKWDLTQKSVIDLLDFVQPLWSYEDRFVRRHHTLRLSTGGWSGNEDIIGALRRNFLFWSMYWFKTQRGGHYWFNDRMVSQELRGFLPTRKHRKQGGRPNGST